MQQTNKRYTIGEEIFNSVTHGVGVLIAIAFMVLLIIKSQGNTPLIIANIIYGVSLMLMFLSSTLYHAITNTKAKQVLRYFDHSAIFICIAGTFTPIIVRVLQGAQRVGFLVAIWLIALVGIILKITIFKKISKKIQKAITHTICCHGMDVSPTYEKSNPNLWNTFLHTHIVGRSSIFHRSVLLRQKTQILPFNMAHIHNTSISSAVFRNIFWIKFSAKTKRVAQ